MSEVKQSVLLDETLEPNETRAIEIAISNQESLLIKWIMTDANATNNLDDMEVRLVVEGIVLPTVLTASFDHTGGGGVDGPVEGVIAAVRRYDARGLGKVQIRVKNAANDDRHTKIVATGYW